MRKFQRAVVVLGCLTVGAGATGFVATGCSSGSGSTVSPQEDASADATTDVVESDANVDSSLDSGAETGSDTGSATGNDAGMDSSADVGSDAQGIDSGVDAGDAAPPGILFAQQIAQAQCAKLQACCGASANHFDMASCMQNQEPYGWNLSSTGYGLLANGNVQFNAAAAASCLNDIAAIDCTANVITGAQSQAIYKDCYAAYSGTLAVGSPCQDTIECASGTFCNVSGKGADGGATFACAALEADGGPCGQVAIANGTGPNGVNGNGPLYGAFACSDRGSGANGEFCLWANLSTFAILDAGTWACTPELPAGAKCVDDIDCVTKLCDPGPTYQLYKCAASETFAYTCGSYFVDAGVKDAGGGG